MKLFGRTLAVAVALLAAAPPVLAQTGARRLTTVDALLRFPSYYHLQNVLLRGELIESDRRPRLRANERVIDVRLADGARTMGGPVEVRAQLIDVGRLEEGDPRLTGYTRDTDRWPRPGEELLLSVTAVTPVDAPSALTLHGLALEPWRYEGQTVTLTGQFRGRNLFGDLAGAPAKSKYDFVLRSGDGAVWITGLRPKGRGFDLDVDARVDTSQWLEITGVVRRERSLVTIEASKMTATTARTDVVTEEPALPPPPPMPVEVVFSSPSPDETEVPTGTVLRLQFSQGLNPSTIDQGFRVTYVDREPSAPLGFRTSYDIATRSVEISLAEPLIPFRTVKVETLAGLKGFNGAVVTLWTMTFSAGG